MKLKLLMETLFRSHFSPSQVLKPVPFCSPLLSNILCSRRTQTHPLLSLSTVPFLVQAPSPPVFILSSSDCIRHSLHWSCISLQIKAPLCALEPWEAWLLLLLPLPHCPLDFSSTPSALFPRSLGTCSCLLSAWEAPSLLAFSKARPSTYVFLTVIVSTFPFLITLAKLTLHPFHSNQIFLHEISYYQQLSDKFTVCFPTWLQLVRM